MEASSSSPISSLSYMLYRWPVPLSANLNLNDSLEVFHVSWGSRRSARCVHLPRPTRAITVFLSYFPVLLNCFWRIDEFGGEERSGLPPNSSILIICVVQCRRTQRTSARTARHAPHSRTRNPAHELTLNMKCECMLCLLSSSSVRSEVHHHCF